MKYSHIENVLQFSTLLFINLRTFLLQVQREATLYSTSGECLILCLPYTITPVDFFLFLFCWAKQVVLRFFSSLFLFPCPRFFLFPVLIWSFRRYLRLAFCFVPALCASKPRPFRRPSAVETKSYITNSHSHLITVLEKSLLNIALALSCTTPMWNTLTQT